MSIWRDTAGSEVVVCDTCGITEYGSHDKRGLTKIDLTAKMLAAGFQQGTALDCRDTCPDCERNRTKRGGNG